MANPRNNLLNGQMVAFDLLDNGVTKGTGSIIGLGGIGEDLEQLYIIELDKRIFDYPYDAIVVSERYIQPA